MLKELVANADVLIENYRLDVKFRLGIDYDSLREVNPRLIYTSVSGFGQDGPYGDRAGIDQIAQGMGGLMVGQATLPCAQALLCLIWQAACARPWEH